MTLSGTITPGDFALTSEDEQRLLSRLEEASSRARRHGRTVLGAVTVTLDPAEIPAKEGLARLLSEIAHAVAEIIGRPLTAIAFGIIAVGASLWYLRQYLR